MDASYNKISVNLNLYPISLGCFVLLIVSIWIAFIQIVVEYDIVSTIISISLFVYSIIMGYNIIYGIDFDDSNVYVRKTFKSYTVKNISSISIIKIKWLGSLVIIKIYLTSGKNIIGHYIYHQREQDILITNFENFNFALKIKNI